MANEITITASLACFKASIMESPCGRAVAGLQFAMAANFYVQGTILAAVGGTAIPLGQVTTPHWAYFLNLDAANFLRLANGASGAKLAKLKAGEPAFFPLDDTAAPYAFADTAACLLEYLIFGM